MTDEQLDRLEQMLVDLGEYGRFKWLPGVRTLLADYRRLRELERACRMARIIPGGLKGHYYAHEQAGLATIGRLLEGAEDE